MNKGCPKCGRMIEQKYEKCPHCNYDFSEIEKFFKKVEEEKYKEEKYAGFIKRLVAGMIDTYITIILTVPLFIKINEKITKENIKYLLIILFIVNILYNSLLERTKIRGSLGKKIIKIEVTDEYENPVTLPKALIRNILKLFNILTLGLGFLICAASEKKQTLGDIISKTYVLNKKDLTEERVMKVSKIYKRLIAYIIDILYISLLLTIEYYALTYLFNNIIKNYYIYEKTIYQLISLFTVVMYFPYNESKKGKTRGKKLLKIKITSIEKEKISFTTSLIRYLMIVIDLITLGFLLPISNNTKQTLKDMITKTIIIDE